MRPWESFFLCNIGAVRGCLTADSSDPIEGGVKMQERWGTTAEAVCLRDGKEGWASQVL